MAVNMKPRKKAKPKRTRPSGYPCPLCDATRTRVLHTDTLEDKFQRRRRRCPKGHEFETDEIIRPDGGTNALNLVDVRTYADSLAEALKSDPLFHLTRGTMNRGGLPT
jgi:hypothetical protein